MFRHHLLLCLLITFCFVPVFAQDTDADTYADVDDLDDDNDGILDSAEALACYDITLVQGGLSSGDDTELTYGNDNASLDANFTGADAPIASSTNLVAGAGISISKNASFAILDVSGISSATLAEAQVNNDYIEFSFTTLEGAVGIIDGARHYAVFNSPAVTFSLSFEISDNGGASFQNIANFPNQSGTGTYPNDINVSSASDYPISSDQSYIVRIYVYGLSTGTELRIDDIGLAFDYCQHQDTDGDNVFDYLDLDSDNDGCPDAIEGAGSYILADLDTDGAITATPDTDGVPNSGADQAVGSSQDANTVVCCDASDSGYPDADGDDIADGCDLDDDNDGILDTDECTSLGPELVVNGDFEDGYANWTSDFSRGRNNYAATAGGCSAMGWIAVSPCASLNGACNDYYNYNGSTPDGATIITDAFGTGANVIPTSTCNATSGTCLASSLPDHTTGTGMSVYIDPNDIVGQAYWKQDVSVAAHKVYTFSAWVMVIEEDPNVEFKIGGKSLTGGINLDRLTGGSNGTDQWQQIATEWYSGNTTGTVTLELVNLTAGCGGNDIRIDDISLRESLSFCDTDTDGYPDILDIDADNDGIVDNTEAQGTGVYVAPSGIDTDRDGLDDVYDPDCTPCGAITGVAITLANTDGDSSPDFQDLDSDEDGQLDILEGHDTNNDDLVDGLDAPNANTGLANGLTDSDGDGLLDGFDNDLGSWDATNGGLSALSHPDAVSGTSERDWRENVALPVEWLSFNGQSTEAGALLQWITASETNADHYVIERSVDGILFGEIGQLAAQGNTQETTSYEFVDQQFTRLAVPSIYYRLRQIDENGDFALSQQIELSIATDQSMILLPMPVPADKKLSLRYVVHASSQTQIQIVSALGQVMMRQPLRETNGQIELSVSDWPSGVYYAQLIGEKQKVVYKISVQH